MIVGAATATKGELHYTLLGIFVTLLGVLLAAFKGISTNYILTTQEISTPELLSKMSLHAIWQCTFAAYLSGEVTDVIQYGNDVDSDVLYSLVLLVTGNGILAFLLNAVSFSANKKTSELTMSVSANLKQVMSVLVSVGYFGYVLTRWNVYGVILSMAGGTWYR